MLFVIHSFPSTGDAYDATQCDPCVKTGDLLVITSEQVVGIAYTWPVAVTKRHGALHYLSENSSFKDLGIEESAKQAVRLAELLGYPL